MRKLVGGLVLTFLALPSFANNLNQIPPNILSTMEKVIGAVAPGAVLDDVLKDKKTGLYLLVSRSGGHVYVSKDGDSLFLGNLASIESAGVVNRTQSVLLHRVIDVPEENMIIYPSKIKEVGRVTIFFDVDCQYCRLMHRAVKDLNDYGITVRYLAYPRGGPDTTSADIMRGIWCRDNARSQLSGYIDGSISGDELIAKGKLPNNCGYDVVKRDYGYGRSIDLKGTPGVLFDDDSFFNYYMSASKIFKKATQGLAIDRHQ